MKKSFIAITTTFLLLIACSYDPVMIDPETLGDPYVFCVLSPYIETQHVLVGKTRPEDLPEDVSGAEVILSYGDKNIQFAEYNPGIYHDAGNEVTIIPGETYYLRVRFPDDFVLLDSTTVPGSFELLSPSVNDTVDYYYSPPYDTSKIPILEWSTSIGAVSYLAKVQFNDETIHGNEKWTLSNRILFPHFRLYYWYYSDTTFILIKNARLSITALSNGWCKYPYMDYRFRHMPEAYEKHKNTQDYKYYQRHRLWCRDLKQRAGKTVPGFFKSLIKIETDITVRVHVIQRNPPPNF